MTAWARWLAAGERSALAFVRRWWRPGVCLSMAASLAVNGTILPLMTRTYPDLLGLAALAAALAPFAWLRTSEKVKGVNDTGA